MAETSQIQWTDATWNPWHGCRKVSQGCKFCYMYRDKAKYGQDPTVVVRSKGKFDAPIHWPIENRKVFTCSWSDWFIEEADQPGWRDHAWMIVDNTPYNTYQILTKRPERILSCLPDNWGNGYRNVWLGVSVEDIKAKERIDLLRKVPAAVRFLSIEPLLEDIGKLDLRGIHWVIVGGESGNDNGKYLYRPCELEWIDNVVNECMRQGVPVFVKQLGTYLSKKLGIERHGGNINEFPPYLQFRLFPKLI